MDYVCTKWLDKCYMNSVRCSQLNARFAPQTERDHMNNETFTDFMQEWRDKLATAKEVAHNLELSASGQIEYWGATFHVTDYICDKYETLALYAEGRL